MSQRDTRMRKGTGKSPRVYVSFPADIYGKIQARATEQGISDSKCISDIVTEHFRPGQPTAPITPILPDQESLINELMKRWQQQQQPVHMADVSPGQAVHQTYEPMETNDNNNSVTQIEKSIEQESGINEVIPAPVEIVSHNVTVKPAQQELQILHNDTLCNTETSLPETKPVIEKIVSHNVTVKPGRIPVTPDIVATIKSRGDGPEIIHTATGASLSILKKLFGKPENWPKTIKSDFYNTVMGLNP